MWRIGDDNISVRSRLCSLCGSLVLADQLFIIFDSDLSARASIMSRTSNCVAHEQSVAYEQWSRTSMVAPLTDERAHVMHHYLPSPKSDAASVSKLRSHSFMHPLPLTHPCATQLSAQSSPEQAILA